MKIKYSLKPKNIIRYLNPPQIVSLIFTIIFFIVLTFYVTTNQLTAIDLSLQTTIQDVLPNWFIYFAKFSYFLGEAEVAVFIVLFSLIFLIKKKLWLEAQVMALSCLSVLLLVDKVLKPLFAVPRPVDRLVDNIHGYSYPSGHGSGNLLLYLLIVYFIGEYFPHLKVTLYTLVSLFMIVMGVSSVYLGVHWVTDFLASYCVGYVLFSLSVLLHKSSQ